MSFSYLTGLPNVRTVNKDVVTCCKTKRFISHVTTSEAFGNMFERPSTPIYVVLHQQIIHCLSRTDSKDTDAKHAPSSDTQICQWRQWL